jgi:class 3 adenylate cyclase/tetratricopeptide (TPR) repeat protein
MIACSRCGREAEPAAAFCAGCGAALAAVQPAREERKVVTVLFADLVGSTSRAEGLDPEDVRAILSPFYARLRSELERFGGTVEKFIGDAVMAVFGAPVAHEDDPERAVRAALAIRDWVLEDQELQVRIAVHTGEALVALDARPAEGEGMVAGDVVNTAARLQSAAPVNGIVVGEQTYRATERAIEYREHEPVQAKGKAVPVAVWEAMQARSRLGVDLARATGAPLIGRDQELELLVAALGRAREERAPQLVTLVGVPGIGKSRLLAELFAAVERGDELTTWRQGRSLPYGEGVSYWALGEMVKAHAGLLETDPPEETGAKLAAAIGRLLPDPAEARWVESHLRPLAGIAADDQSGDRRGEAFAAWRRFFEALAEVRPLVLVFEDLHWADDGLLDFVDHLVDWLTDVPVLVVGTARPELLARRPAWGGGKANAATVSLSPLSQEETARLVHALLEQAVMPSELQAALLERAGGNPLYAEEFVRMVGERGMHKLDLPESVQGIIAGRLDGLPPQDKALLQDAAVVGKVFWSGALAALGGGDRFEIEQRLHALERRELVRRERRSSVAGESEHAFLHVLVRDVAYAAIPRATRAERHRAAADWIESLGRPDDQADLLAHHYLSALELARAAGTDAGVLSGAAAAALVAAGDRAAALNSFDSAVRFYDEALALGTDEADRAGVLLRLGAALHVVGHERRVDVLEQARDLLAVGGELELAAEASLMLAEAWWLRGQRDRAIEHLDEARARVRGRGTTAAAARVLTQVARYAMLGGTDEEAMVNGREALRMAEQLGLEEVAILALNVIGTSRANSGDRGGIADLERAVELATAANSPEAPRAYNNLGTVLYSYGDLRRAGTLWRAGREIAARLGTASIGRYLDGVTLWAEYDSGDWEAFVRAANAFIGECEAGSPHYLHGDALGLRARVHLARDDVEAAARDASRAVALGRKAKDAQAVRHVLGAALIVDVALGRRTDARVAARELLAVGGNTVPLWLVAEDVGLRDEAAAAIATMPPTAWTRVGTALLAGELEAAADMFGAMGDLPDEATARLRAAERLVKSGHRAEADVQLAKALDFWRSVGATRYVREGEGLLAATA